MDVLIYLLPIALALGIAGLTAFFWALKSGQFDDPEGAANRILQDEKLPVANAFSGQDKQTQNQEIQS